MTDAPSQKRLLTGDHFYKFFQCPHWIWYDIYGDQKQKKEAPPILDLIFRGKAIDGHEHIRPHKKFEELKPDQYKDLDETFQATLALMKEGKNIYHGVLMHEHWVGMPDLLEARPIDSAQGKPGKSNLGDWYYVVYDIQNSLDLRDEYKFQLIFYSLILEQIQGVRPAEAYVIDTNGNELSFKVDDFIEQFHLTRIEIEKVLNGEKPAPFLKSGCKRSPWYSICLSETEGCQDVSLIYRMSQSDQRRLYNIGIRTVQDLANADVDDLRSKLEEWPFDKIIRFNNQAKVLIAKEPMVFRKANFPKVAREIYFDIESDPTNDVDYLLGFIDRKTETGVADYHHFVAKDKTHEPEIWARFLDFLAGLEDFVIYHYTYAERQIFDRLVLRYGAPQVLVDKFRENTIDLHAQLVDSVILPLYFYSLKDVGRYLGYEWNDGTAGGAESILWYREWLAKGEESTLKKIIQYNEDDVRATMKVKDWLEQQKPSKKKESLDEE